MCFSLLCSTAPDWEYAHVLGELSISENVHGLFLVLTVAELIGLLWLTFWTSNTVLKDSSCGS